MDEVENPSLPAAGESSPTLRPVDSEDDIATSEAKVPNDTAEAEGLVDSANPSPTVEPVLPIPHDSAPVRPQLKREASAPPPSQPPPAPPAQPADVSDFPQDPPDSLTLADLKRIRSTFPNAQAPPREQIQDYGRVYDFEYQDAQSLPVELEEWFSYSDHEEVALRKCKAMFNQEWRASEHGSMDWLDVMEDVRREFVKGHVDALRTSDEKPMSALMILTYIGLGVWEETAGQEDGSGLADIFSQDDKGGYGLNRFKSSGLQIRWIIAMVDAIHACDGLKVIYDLLRSNFEETFDASPVADMPIRNDIAIPRPNESMELWCCLTLMYVFIEVARTTEGTSGKALKQDVLALEPKLVNYITAAVGRLRWDDHAAVPFTKMLSLAWKVVLVTFGGIKDVEHVKASQRDSEEERDVSGKPIITASPLDYHLFRQEISSKYPAYQAPQPLFPLEPDSNTILPPLKHRQPSLSSASDSVFTGAPNVGTHSIMHQPVHIATPAPSPPPSPGGPGKAGKKQNYQTNQMFPFLYPPLDGSSSELGGKGTTQLQDALVGRRWEGADIPTSILEAAELFAKRMRATRAMKQLWEARVDFMKDERGWKPSADDENDDVDDFELLPKPPPEESAPQGEPVPMTEGQKRLKAVDDFYHDSLPYLQSVIIVLLKSMLHHISDMDMANKTNGQNGLQAGIQFQEPNGVNGPTKPMENSVPRQDGIENTADELNKLRSEEIAGKALSGFLILLLKWFKASHILQYEYLTQLLLDSNYVPMVLKLWSVQEIGRACHHQLEKEEQNFFYFCQANSRQGPPAPPHPGSATMFDDSEDEAAPPPIKRNRDHADEQHASPGPDVSQHDFEHPPEVDELGYPQTLLPDAPIQNYNYRNVFTFLNYLRILQKVTRRKTHRALLLVSYKSSNHLKKTLKIPIWGLRYYTLKLFKSQVPFCGRKWRQGNMKIITAVWLSVPAELRDDWLSGGGGGMGGACVGDVDGTVEDALPLEQSIRALTHWWNVRNYPDVMVTGQDKDASGLGLGGDGTDDEAGFFERELEKMEMLRVAVGEGMEDGVEDPQTGVEDGGPGGGQGLGWNGPMEGY